jgi:hypothetical protein
MSWVLGYHSNAAEDSELLGCNGALLDRQVTISCAKEPSKCDRVLVQQHGTSMSGTPSTGLLEHEDKGIMTLKNIANDLPNDTVAHPKALQTSAIPMCDPQI